MYRMLSVIRHGDLHLIYSLLCGFFDRLVALRTDNEWESQANTEPDKAAQQWQKHTAKLPLSWLEHDKTAEQFAAFRKLTPKRKQTLLTWVVANNLKFGIAQDTDSATEAFLSVLDPDYPRYWRPTADNYLGRVTRVRLLEHAGECLGQAWVEEHQKDKKGDLVKHLDHFFNGKSVKALPAAAKKSRETWLPEGFKPK